MRTDLAAVRSGAVGLMVAGVLFVLYPVTRPWHDEATSEGAMAAMTAGAWLASHLFAVVGFVLLPLGLAALNRLLARAAPASLALVAAVTAWIGAGLTLPYYGAETFGLHAIAGAAARGELMDLLGLVEAVRIAPAAIAVFLLGLPLLAAGGVMAAIAVWRTPVLPRYAGLPLALGLVLFIPQFFTPPAVRIAHGLLLGGGLAWLGLALWRGTAERTSSAS